MKFLLIGQSVEDHIYYKKEYMVKPGGIYYSVVALEYFKESDDEIYLCTARRKNDRLFSGLYDKVKPDFFNYSRKIPRVRLNIFDDMEREEIYENITGNLYVNTENLNQFDGILINMVTGFDISLEQMQQIRKNFHGSIYFDVHTFSRGLSNNMERVFRLIPGFDKWLQNIDILQVNSRELFTLMDSGDKDEIIKFILGTNVKCLLETKGENGAFCYTIDNGLLTINGLPSLNVDVRNQVGLGDVFGAVFFYSYIKNRSLNQALKYAVSAGGIAASYTNIDDFKNLRTDVFKRNN